MDLKKTGITLLIILAAAALIFFLTKFILKSIKNSQEEKTERGLTASLTNETFTKLQEKVYKKYGKPKTQTEFQELAKKQFPNLDSFERWIKIIFDAKKPFFAPDSEDQVMGVFQQSASKFELSYLSKRFLDQKNTGLMPYIQSFFDTDQMLILNEIIRKKPDIL